jgi:CubicO group peptidase (beta-lactamase class C family)
VRAVAGRLWRPFEPSGLVVGVSTPEWRFVLGFGHVERGGTEPTGETVFEIASVTKVFTALALVVIAGRGLVALDDPVRPVLPDRVRLPSRRGQQITFRQLAMHTSGLPTHPLGAAPRWLLHPSRPYAGLTAEAVYRGLGRSRLRSEPGSRWRYSNLGMGLLGMALEEVTGEQYEALVERLICAPLGLRHTRIAPGATERLALGYGRFGGRLPPGSQGALAGAGDLRSSANDLIRFTRLGLAEGPTELVDAARVSLSARFRVGDGSHQALGWRVWRLGGDEWPGHGGSSAGYRSSISLHAPTRTAIVALGNGRQGTQAWFDNLVPELWKSLPLTTDA